MNPVVVSGEWPNGHRAYLHVPGSTKLDTTRRLSNENAIAVTRRVCLLKSPIANCPVPEFHTSTLLPKVKDEYRELAI